jgi:hypothetical protein
MARLHQSARCATDFVVTCVDTHGFVPLVTICACGANAILRRKYPSKNYEMVHHNPILPSICWFWWLTLFPRMQCLHSTTAVQISLYVVETNNLFTNSRVDDHVIIHLCHHHLIQWEASLGNVHR